MDIKLGILKKGDKVISVFPYGESFAVAIQRKGSEVDVVVINKDLDGVPRVGSKIFIREGDDVVEIHTDTVKVITA